MLCQTCLLDKELKYLTLKTFLTRKRLPWLRNSKYYGAPLVMVFLVHLNYLLLLPYSHSGIDNRLLGQLIFLIELY